MSTSAQPVTISSSSPPPPPVASYPPVFVVIISVFLVAQLVVGLVCNILVLCVFHWTGSHRRQGPSLVGPGSSPDPISAALVTSLNVVDVVTGLVAVPLTITYVLWGPGQSLAFCLLHEAAVSFVTCASALNLIVISLDRYHHIVRPLQHNVFTRSNLKWVLTTLWLLSAAGLCGPFFTLIGAERLPGPHHELCMSWAEIYGRRVFFEFFYIALYVFANVVIVVCYVRILRAAKAQFLSRAITSCKVYTMAQPASITAHARSSERSVTMTSLLVVLTFMACWAPHVVTTAVSVLSPPTVGLEMARLACVTVAYTATLLHPLLYAFIKKSFRQALCSGMLKRHRTVHPAQVEVHEAAHKPANPTLPPPSPACPQGRTTTTGEK